MSDTKNTENESGGLKKSLRLIYVYAIAAGAIFTFIGYWDTIFYEYCGAGTFFRIYPDDAVDPSDCYGLLRTGTVVSKGRRRADLQYSRY